MSSSELVPLSTTEKSCAARGARSGAIFGTRASAGSARIARRKGIFVSLARLLFSDDQPRRGSGNGLCSTPVRVAGLWRLRVHRRAPASLVAVFYGTALMSEAVLQQPQTELGLVRRNFQRSREGLLDWRA